MRFDTTRRATADERSEVRPAGDGTTLTHWPPAYALFYPAAACYAALVLPASVLAMTGAIDGPLADPNAHAHELLLGFALAVVAGNQLGVARGPFVVASLLLWVTARGAFLVAPASIAAAALNAAFAGALAWRIVPRLAGAAKKWRNKALPGVLAGICAAAAAWQVARHAGEPGVPRALVIAIVLLFATLMLYMGGRIIAPAIAGQLYRQGRRLEARVQPRLEGALIVCGAAAVVAALFEAAPVAATAAGAAGVLALVRMSRWRAWEVRGRSDLICLCVGYGWLGTGLAALGAALAARRNETAALHLITVGALGTLTFTVMATLWATQARSSAARSPAIVLGTVLMAVSALLRVVGAFLPGSWLLASAACWSATFGLLLMFFWRTRRQPGAPGHEAEHPRLP